jgi:glycosyltransferase involved in cell wall biosynthesis
MVRQLARFHEVWVLTHPLQRASIQQTLAHSPCPNLRFEYVSLPDWLEPLISIQGGIQLYAYLWQWRAYFAARRLHREFQFDVFHHVTYANDWMASFIGALLPVPYIRGPGGGAQRIPKQFLGGFSRRNRFWERVRAAGQWLFRHDPFFILGQRRARAILVCAPEAMDAIPRKLRAKAQLFPVNGITSEDLAAARAASESTNEPHPGKSIFHVLTAGKLLQLKGFDLAIQAFQKFSEKFPDGEFTIIGDGPERLRLESLIRELHLEETVRIEPWMTRVELLRRMASCDVFLFPSLRDGGGAVVVEAMAAAKPVVCLDVAGPGMHGNEQCGIKFRPSSPGQAVRDLAAALEQLYGDEKLRRRMGQAARERAEQAYHWDRHGERMLEIYENALGSPHQEAAEQPVTKETLEPRRV